jgi:hypothetical protein
VVILSWLLHAGEVGRSIEWVPAGVPHNRPRLDLREKPQQDIRVNRLEQMEVDARVARLSSILGSSVTRHGDDDSTLEGCLLPEPQGDLIAIHVGQTEVQQDHLRSPAQGGCDRLRGVAGGLDFMAMELQEPGHALDGVHAIIDHEDASAWLHAGCDFAHHETLPAEKSFGKGPRIEPEMRSR